MKATIALLLGLLTISAYAQDDTDSDTTDDSSGEQFSWDSDEEGETNTYGGVVVQVYKDEGDYPIITLGTELDNHEDVYCFTFKGVFEATNYDNSANAVDVEYDEVDGSAVDLVDANCTVSETSSTSFTIACNDINEGTLSLIFNFTTNDDGDYGLEYTIMLEDYEFVSDDPDAKLVVIQSLDECSDEYEYSGDSESDSDEESEGSEDEDDEEESEEEEEEARRRLQDDDDEDDEDDEEDDDDESASDDDEESDKESDSDESEESGDGFSSDSGEFDEGYAEFIVDGQAYDKCEGEDDKAIGSALIYQSEDDELQIVFDRFECVLSLDPFIGLDSSKVTTGDANTISFMFAVVVGVIAVLYN